MLSASAYCPICGGHAGRIWRNFFRVMARVFRALASGELCSRAAWSRGRSLRWLLASHHLIGSLSKVPSLPQVRKDLAAAHPILPSGSYLRPWATGRNPGGSNSAPETLPWPGVLVLTGGLCAPGLRGLKERGPQASSVLGSGVTLCIPIVLARTFRNGLRPCPAPSRVRL